MITPYKFRDMEFLCKPLNDTRKEQEEKLEKDPFTELPPSSSSSNSSEHREHMFEKVVTPSDVGKLNRLVIPKQHAERYFPLDPSSNEKGGLLLSFEEDRTGRPWRFRYSYWNSSQSYVMTKGWSRFVKDKHLDAGDTVLFSRGSEGRLYIDWRRRPVPPDPMRLVRSVVPPWGWGSVFTPPLYFRSTMPQIAVDHGILESVPVVSRGSSIEPRRSIRLFGVNLESSGQEETPLPLQWRLSVVAPMPTTNNELQLMPSSEIEGAKKN